MTTLVAALMYLQTLHLCLPHRLLHSGSSSVTVFLIRSLRRLGGCLETYFGGVFVQHPIYASKQPPNLRQLLIRNTVTDDEPECNKPCGKHRCKVCKHINAATNVFINHKTVKPGNYICDSANVVYLIHCQK